MIESQNKTEQEYVEIIHALEKQNKVARVKNIAQARNVTKACVSLELTHLSKKNLITHEQYGHVTLTKKGRQLANHLQKRHKTIKKFLVQFLGVSESIAEIDACNMEHIITDHTLGSLSVFLDFIEKCPRNWKNVAGFFSECGKFGSGSKQCDQCSEIIVK